MPRLLCLFLLAAAALGGDRAYDFREKTLPNGLRVLTLEDFSAPTIAVQLWYHVGSKDERPDRQGFAHMFEHMMFRGTERVGPKEFDVLTTRAGGSNNAFTSFDNTTYVNELPANQLDLILWLEVERMLFLQVDAMGFHTERQVVEEERRESNLNPPYGTVPEQVLERVFTKHPYRWMPIGRIPHLRAATLEELESFWSTFYVPNNAVLVVAGAVKHEQAQKAAERWFGWVPKCPEPPRVTEREPELLYRTLEDGLVTAMVSDGQGGVVVGLSPHVPSGQIAVHDSALGLCPKKAALAAHGIEPTHPGLLAGRSLVQLDGAEHKTHRQVLRERLSPVSV